MADGSRSEVRGADSAHFGRKGSRGLPGRRLPGAHLLHHLVDLLKRQALHLRHQEVGECETEHAKRAPDEEHLGSQVGGPRLIADHVGGDDGDDTVPQPVGSGRDTDAARTDRQRETLTDNDPRAGTPRDSEEGNVDADEGDHGLDGARVVRSFGSSCHADDGDDELHGDHPSSAPDEEEPTAKVFDRPERDRS